MMMITMVTTTVLKRSQSQSSRRFMTISPSSERTLIQSYPNAQNGDKIWVWRQNSENGLLENMAKRKSTQE